jgi:hypothetical protein
MVNIMEENVGFRINQAHSISPSAFFFFLETGYHYVSQPGLELLTFLPQPPKCWDRQISYPVSINFFSCVMAIIVLKVCCCD